MLPQDGGTTAAQLLIDKQHARVVAAQEVNAALTGDLRQILPDGLGVARERIAELESGLTRSVNSRPELSVSEESEATGSPGEPGAPKNVMDLTKAATNNRAKETGTVCEPRSAALASAQILQKPVQTGGDGDQALALGMISCNQTEPELSDLKKKISRYEGLMERVTASDRELEVMQNLMRENEIRLRGALKAPTASILKAPERIRIVDRPRDPDFPTKSRLLYAIAGIIGSVIVGSTLALCVDFLDSRIFYPEELADLGKLPIIATLPNLGQALRKGRQGARGEDRLPAEDIGIAPRGVAAEDEQAFSVDVSKRWSR
jgi:hypothetical protein